MLGQEKDEGIGIVWCRSQKGHVSFKTQNLATENLAMKSKAKLFSELGLKRSKLEVLNCKKGDVHFRH